MRAFLLGVCLFAMTAAGQQSARVDVLDPHQLPLGDGRVSTSPQRGYVWSCQSSFRGDVPGARFNGAWIHGATWDLTQKLSVQGKVTWPAAQFAVALRKDGARMVSRRVEGNGLPVQTLTGVFPVQRNDPASRIDPNPNAIAQYQVAFSLPANPAAATQSACVGMGMIGVALNGVAIFNALDAGGRDAVAHEVQDLCSGHPQQQGEYHYHVPSACLPGQDGREALIGYALDGFGITSRYDAQGRELTNADLDECHGRVSEIDWDGQRVRMYHYVLTREYPYTIGCYRGAPLLLPRRGPSSGGGRPPPPL